MAEASTRLRATLNIVAVELTGKKIEIQERRGEFEARLKIKKVRGCVFPLMRFYLEATN